MFPERLLDVVVLEAPAGGFPRETSSRPAPGPMARPHLGSTRCRVPRFGPMPLPAQLSGRVLPQYLTSRDHGWVEAALDALGAAAGRARHEVEERLARPPDQVKSWRAWRALCFLLLRLSGFKVRACAPPSELRAEVFTAAASRTHDRQTVLEQIARKRAVSVETLAESLYADVPEARVLEPLSAAPSIPELIERYNLALAQSLLVRSEQLVIHVRSQLNAVLRLARLRGLLCLAERHEDGSGAVLHLSGPLALFHHTVKYGSAMGAWLPVVIRTPRWALEATCVLRGQRLLWRAGHRDPIGTTHAPPRRFDSKVEERLFRDLKRIAPSWEVRREAEIVTIGRRIACPDFTLVDDARRLRVPIEIVGFWTPEYLEQKLDLLQQLPSGVRWIVCVDSGLRAASEPRGFGRADVLWYTRRVDAAELLRFIEARRAAYTV